MISKMQVSIILSTVLLVLLVTFLTLGHSRPSGSAPDRKMIKETRLASQHVQKMTVQGRCQVPIRELVKVTDIYKDTEPKEYRPSCVFLHRCSDRSGCCGVSQRCAPTREENVTLYFQVLDFSVLPPKPSVETLVFKNHTECYCEEINNMPR